MPALARVMTTSKRLAEALRPLPRALAGRARDARRHDASQVLLPKYLLRRQLGMTTAGEQAYFEWYARHRYTGSGAIVDLGCWLGSTTIPLAAGLSRNPDAGGARIHAYDRFVWEPWMGDTSSGAPLRSRYRPGDVFTDAFEERLGAHRDRVVTHVADLAAERWTGGPIEFLLVDAMKTWPLCDAIVSGFFPHVQPGGMVLQQDFSHHFTPWVHVVNYRLRDYLRPVYDVPRSSSSVFEVVRAIPGDVAATPSADRAYGAAEIEEIFAYSMAIVPAEKHPSIAAAKIKLLADLGDADAARTELAEWNRRVGEHRELTAAATFLA